MKLDKSGFIFLAVVCFFFGFGALAAVVFANNIFELTSRGALTVCGFIGGFVIAAAYVCTVCEFIPGMRNEQKVPQGPKPA